jgi:hypothetical protein
LTGLARLTFKKKPENRLFYSLFPLHRLSPSLIIDYVIEPPLIGRAARRLNFSMDGVLRASVLSSAALEFDRW